MEFDIPEGTGPAELSELFWNIAKKNGGTLVDFYEGIRELETKKCLFLWRGEPKGTGEAAAIIVPMDDKATESYNKFTGELLEIFDATIDSEETIEFRIQYVAITDIYKER